ncbi:MAG: TrkA family potassium uptake protein [Bacteroidetes bacterium]|jgi:trk system potassium uptake protein TrkA|nr:TrkA family potassium uptake protein [Sphingomonadales bacterium]MBU6191800.1 TrkA family potassium uptake protein [Bacteroidota bacterium]NBY29616.1 TrkA family potassium uptake protein [Sphingobacteriia bacterium]NDC72349.1 TrkA family potassium uptake protein [Sphingobacteriia bacterium]
MENRFGVIGLGRFGTTIARTLAQRGAEVIVMDNDAHAIDALRDDVAYAVHMDATNIKLLREQSVQDLDAVVVAIGQDFEGLLLTTVTLIELGVKRIIARASTEQQRRVLEKLGVTEILSPEDEVGISVAGRLLNPNLVNVFQLPDDYQIVEVKTPAGICNKTVLEIELRSKYKLNLITLRRAYEIAVEDGSHKVEYHILGVPGADTMLYASDFMVLLGKREDIERFVEVNR